MKKATIIGVSCTVLAILVQDTLGESLIQRRSGDDLFPGSLDGFREARANFHSSDFVAFSYSRSAPRIRTPSTRFIHFLKENVNVNSNFLTTFGSFKASLGGVYSFTYSFATDKGGSAVVSLRKNGHTVVSARCDGSPSRIGQASQSALVLLEPGDTVQLEVLEGEVWEPRLRDLSYTSFSGHLITSSGIGRGGGGGGGGECVCCPQSYCKEDNVIRAPVTPKPPYYSPPPTYYPPPPRTTLKPSYEHPPQTARPPFFGRADHCCDSLLVTSSYHRVRSIQSEKMGVYRRLDRDTTSSAKVYKHCENEVYLYQYSSLSGWHGWVVGPEVGAGRGGLILRTESECVEDDILGHWEYFDTRAFKEDAGIEVECYTGGTHQRQRYGEGETTEIIVEEGRKIADEFDQKHFHHHEHYHHPQTGSGGNLEDRTHHHGKKTKGPGYTVKSNRDFVEATFVFPNRKNVSGHHHHNNAYDHHSGLRSHPVYANPGSHHQPLDSVGDPVHGGGGVLLGDEAVIEARRQRGETEGIIQKRSSEDQDDDSRV